MPTNQRVVRATDQLLICYEIHHRGKLLEGGLQDKPQAYQMGGEQWPTQLEQKMIGQRQGGQIQVPIQAVDSVFGETDPQRIVQMKLSDFAEMPEPGALIEFKLPQDQQAEGQILSIMNDVVEVDFNHPYSGRDLDFHIRIHAII